MGFMDDVNAKRFADQAAEDATRGAAARAQDHGSPRSFDEVRELAALCRAQGVASIALYDHGTPPRRRAAEGWLYEYNPGMQVAFDEAGMMWSLVSFGKIITGRFVKREEPINLVSGGVSLGNQAGPLALYGRSGSVAELAVAAGAQVIAGRATNGLIPLDPTLDGKYREGWASR